jgi:hypothetical protein
MTRTSIGRAGFVSLWMIALATVAAAQDDSSIAGVVRDVTGAVLPGVTVRVQGMFDAYNVLNGSPIPALNTRYGPSWLAPTQILTARLFKVGMQLDF